MNCRCFFFFFHSSFFFLSLSFVRSVRSLARFLLQTHSNCFYLCRISGNCSKNLFIYLFGEIVRMPNRSHKSLLWIASKFPFHFPARLVFMLFVMAYVCALPSIKQRAHDDIRNARACMGWPAPHFGQHTKQPTTQRLLNSKGKMEKCSKFARKKV